MPQNDQALLARLKDSGLDFVVIDLTAVRYLEAIKERNPQP